MEYLRKSCFIRPLHIVLLLTTLLAATYARPSSAAERVAVISLKGSDNLLADVDYLLSATGLQGLGQFVLPQVRTYLEGTDGKRPIGILVSVDQMQFVPLGFLPVTGLDGFLTHLQEQLGEPIDAGNGVMQLQGPYPVFVKESGDWAFLGQSKDALAQLPQAPAQLLEGLDQQYGVAIRAYIKNVPQQYKELALTQLREGVERGMADADDPNARQMAEAQIAQLTQFINETDTLTIGWQIDPAQKNTYFDLRLLPVADSTMARQIEAARDSKTAFGGFLVDDAGIRMNMASQMLPDQIEQASMSLDRLEQSTLKQLEDDGDIDNRTRAAAKQLVQTFFKIGRSTIRTGKFDSSTSVILKPQALTLVSAGHVASGAEVDDAVKQLVQLAENQDEFEFSRADLNAEQYKGVRFHLLDIPIPDEEYARKVLGDTLHVVIGVGETSAYVGVGTDALDQLKRGIDASSGTQSVEPFNLEVSLLPVLKFAQSVEPNPMVDALVQVVSGSQGKDHIRVRTSVDEQGLRYRFELEEGVLKILGQAGQMVTVGQGR